MQLKHGAQEVMVNNLLEDQNLQWLAAYQSLPSTLDWKILIFHAASFTLWHPKGYMYYKLALDKLWDYHPELNGHLSLGQSSLQCITNHVDVQNCPFSWCCVTALGDFNSKKEGHIILWKLRLIIEFPPGTCVCLPSAIITHSNIPVGEGELQASFTQYCSGEIFRYVENNFQMDSYLCSIEPEKLTQQMEMRKTHLREGFAKFSKISELLGKKST